LVDNVVGDVEDLKEAREEGKGNRRTWRDHLVTAIVALLAAIAGAWAGKGS
jgi:hypothetical protein